MTAPSRDHGDAALNALQRDLDALKTERAADPRYVGTFPAPDVRGLVNRLRASPLCRHDPLLSAAVECIERDPDVLRTIGDVILAYAEERARLVNIASRAMARSNPVPADAFAAPAHNPGARVIPTGGER